MGDRANVAILNMRGVNEVGRVYLYTHWDGYRLPIVVRDALKLEERWDDEQYLARIVFQAMLGNDTGTTGYGIGAAIGDNNYNILVLHPDTQMIHSETEDQEWVGLSLSFRAYADLTDDQATAYRDTGTVGEG